MTATAQDLDHQRSEALDRANEIRSNRAAFKRELRSKPLDAVAILREGEEHRAWEYMHTMSLEKLLVALPRMGPYRAGKIARGIGLERRLGACTERQRLQLVERLEPLLKPHHEA
jgi:hypothetical protein